MKVKSENLPPAVALALRVRIGGAGPCPLQTAAAMVQRLGTLWCRRRRSG